MYYGVDPPFRRDTVRIRVMVLGLGLGSVVWLRQYRELFPATTMNDGFQNGGPFGMAALGIWQTGTNIIGL